MSNGFPEYAFELDEPVTRVTVQKMLRQRNYRLQETRLKKDMGVVKVYMVDPWADPMMFQIGEYHEDEEPDWDLMYDTAMERHLENKELGRVRDEEYSTWLPSAPPVR